MRHRVVASDTVTVEPDSIISSNHLGFANLDLIDRYVVSFDVLLYRSLFLRTIVAQHRRQQRDRQEQLGPVSVNSSQVASIQVL